MTRRIERAMALLRRGDRSVTEVCFAVGCGSLGTFSSRFTDLVGMPAQQLPTPGGTRDGRNAVVRGETGDQLSRNGEAPPPEPQLT
jgi:AraC-like DNA-binding protein